MAHQYADAGSLSSLAALRTERSLAISHGAAAFLFFGLCRGPALHLGNGDVHEVLSRVDAARAA
ncbi:MAG: hypothetical protein AAFR45_04460, partial [Pseudomonadota bacterium]